MPRRKTIDPVVKPEPITQTMPLKEQVSALDRLIAAKPVTSRVLEIGPELAEHILSTKNVSNRPMKSGKIKQYAADIRLGRWGVTGDTLKFGKDGTLKDGQNRLAAVVRANGPTIKTHAIFGVDPDLFKRMDIGKNRTPGDVFHIAGLHYANHAAAAVRWLMILTSDNPNNRGATFTNEALLDAYRNRFDPVALEESVRVGLEVKKGVGAPVGSTAALHYLMAQDDPEKATRFMLDWAHESGAASAPQRVLQKRMEELLTQGNGRIHEAVRNALIVKAWHGYRDGKAIKARELRYDPSGDPFPPIKGTGPRRSHGNSNHAAGEHRIAA